MVDIDKRATALAATLKARAPHLAEQRADNQAFKKRLANTWREGFTLYEIILVCATELGGDFNDDHRPDAAKDNDFAFDALTGLQARACCVAGEVFELLKGGYPHGAHARWRTLHELAVFSAIIGEHREVAERFLLHEAVEDSTTMDLYQAKLAGRSGYKAFSPEEVANNHARHDAVVSRFGKPFATRYGWAADLFPKQPTFGELEKLAGLDHLRPFYDWSTHIGVHASSRGARLNVLERGNETVLLAGPTNAGLADPGQGALISLVQVTTTLIVNGRPLGETGDDVRRLVAARALKELSDEAGEAFVVAHRRLAEKEVRFQWAEKRRARESSQP
jgi:Family of unknown function (DUF5677)